ncbi:acyl-CoA dehydrogenase family protein [Helicobacter marmotae]|uniref:Acyl-CoA dehydrogenase n=1 Tax=Helicobacter marmotae TaxID=152490 RepID=A0A3D8I717_9HELI|nr:acyl-CoA dehydrogenase family protein [Helicobacter marmotae]RDU60949.1 acyl-CoA dehydrogenase [Helicobacter marmotae]
MLEHFEEIEQTAEAFGKSYLAPITESVDTEGRFPKEAYNELKKQGYMGLLVPKKYGGSGGGCYQHIQVCYHLARFDATTALCYMMHNTATAALSIYATPSQKDEFLPKIAQGQASFALAYSESGSGTHFGLPDIVEQEAGEYRILKGRKSFVTSAQYADYYLTYTNSCKIKGAKNNWIVPRESEGIVHEENVWNGLGMRGNNSKPVQFNDVKLPITHLLGKDGQGEAQAGVVAMYFVAGLGAVYSGVGRAAYDCVFSHIKERQYTDSSRLSDKELVRIHIANLYTKAQSQIALVKQAAKSFDNGDKDATWQIFASRINASNLVMEITELAMRLGGGRAYSKLLPLERYLRDGLAAQVMAPSLDILKIWLSDALLKD